MYIHLAHNKLFNNFIKSKILWNKNWSDSTSYLLLILSLAAYLKSRRCSQFDWQGSNCTEPQFGNHSTIIIFSFSVNIFFLTGASDFGIWPYPFLRVWGKVSVVLGGRRNQHYWVKKSDSSSSSGKTNA